MKKKLIVLFALMIFLASCIPAPVPTSFAVTKATQIPIVTTPTYPTAIFTLTPSSTVSPPSVIPTFISVSLPKGLVITYAIENELWVWKQERLLLITQQENNISTPVLSDDGQWILFRQRHIMMDGITPPSDDLWVVRTDGSELNRLVGSDDLLGITGKEVLINYFDWLPGSHKILFNNEEIIEGPPGSRSLFDLYSVDLAGQITQLLGPGDAGRFVPSPNGTQIALATDSRIKVFDLETRKQRILLEFEPVGVPMDGGVRTPKLVWDPNGQFVMTSILPKNLYYSELYNGEPEQVWQLFSNGQVNLIDQLQPVTQNHAGVTFSPDLQYFFYLNGSCSDAMGMLTVYNIESGEEYPLTCVWNLPLWLPDSEHFIYNLGLLYLGSISDNTSQPLDIFNTPSDSNNYASSIWINNDFFLLVLRSQDVCTLSIATLQGIVTEITNTPSDICPRVDFNLSE